jgi:hypothetical protein
MKQYTKYLLLSLSLLLLLVASVNWLVNPFAIFDAPLIHGFNQFKRPVEGHSRMSKVYQVKNLMPDYIILGSSRALAFPDDYLVPDNATGFNLALASSSTYEQVRMFQHAHAVRKQKRVIIGLDEELGTEVQQGFSEQRLVVDVEGNVQSSWSGSVLQEILAVLLSLDALKASIKTVIKQPEGSIENYIEQDKIKRVKNAGGHRQMFHNMEASVLQKFRNITTESCYQVSDDAENENRDAQSYLRKMIETAYADDIDFNIFFSPVHARYYEAWCLGGSWRGIEDMKRNVVVMVEEAASKYGKRPFPVWDFSGYNIITMEPVPVLGDKETLMRGYWEGSHYTETVSRLMLERMFGDDSAVPDDFGVLLNSGNIDMHLNGIHEQHKLYVASNPGLIEELISLVSER